MKEMGFTYVPGTAGSSVRFDPPNPADSPITIHKRMFLFAPNHCTIELTQLPMLAHPDSTLSPVQLMKIGKRLKRRYGWNENDFVKATVDAQT